VPEDGKAGVRGWFPDSPSLASFLKEHPLSGAIVLVKGSRGIRMEETLSVL
jgi:UDP-N-acetylmuramyl pentapeptide synthase